MSIKDISGDVAKDGSITPGKVKIALIRLPIWPREHMFWCHEDEKFSKPAAQRAL